MFTSSAPGEQSPPPPGDTHGTTDFRRDVLKTHTIVSELRQNATDTHTILSDIHRTIVKGREESDSRGRFVGVTRALSSKINAYRFPDSNQVSDLSY